MKTALLIGSTGLIGRELLTILLNANEYEKVIVFVRKTIAISNPKLEQIVVNFKDLSAIKYLVKGDALFCTLGTTIKTAGSKEAFRKVDFEYPKQFASYAQENGVSQFLVISSLNADIKSSNFYLKTKGELQDYLQKTTFKSVAILQPSLLLGDREEFRLGEKLGAIASKVFSFLLIGSLKKYKPIHAVTVAKAMFKIASIEKVGYQIYESDKLEEIAK